MKHNNKNNNILSDRQKAVLETVKMRLTEKESLEYLKDNGFEVSDTTLYREKSKLEKMKLNRLYQIAKYGFEEQIRVSTLKKEKDKILVRFEI
jgi:arginine repressor